MNHKNGSRTHMARREAGELPAVDIKGCGEDLKQLRANPRLRSPFRYGRGLTIYTTKKGA